MLIGYKTLLDPEVREEARECIELSNTYYSDYEEYEQALRLARMFDAMYGITYKVYHNIGWTDEFTPPHSEIHVAYNEKDAVAMFCDAGGNPDQIVKIERKYSVG